MRLDLGISDRDVKEELVQNAVETIANTGERVDTKDVF